MTSVSAAEIEAIVRLVLERLQTLATARPLPHHQETPSIAVQATVPPIATSQDRTKLFLPHRLVTLEQLRGRLDQVRTVEVPRGTVVTPAVKDELRQRGIQLRRVFAEFPRVARSPELLLIAAEKKSLPSSPRIVAEYREVDIHATVERVQEHLETPHRAVVWCSVHPFAVQQMLGRIPAIRAAQLFSLSDLARAVDEVQPNVLVLDDRRWSLSDLNTLVHQWQVAS